MGPVLPHTLLCNRQQNTGMGSPPAGWPGLAQSTPPPQPVLQPSPPTHTPSECVQPAAESPALSTLTTCEPASQSVHTLLPAAYSGSLHADTVLPTSDSGLLRA